MDSFVYEALPSRVRTARADALFGEFLCGKCLGVVGTALHHKLCHTLGGAFDLPHAETHTILLPHTIADNAASAPDAMARIDHAVAQAIAAPYWTPAPIDEGRVRSLITRAWEGVPPD